MIAKSTLTFAVVLTICLYSAPLVWAVATPVEAVLPVEQYSSEKARTLALRYQGELAALSTRVYHCVPWVEVQKYSIGFYRPRHLAGGDDRYLSIRLFVEQDPSPSFSSLPVEGRASAMFSRYVGGFLRRMTRNPALLADSSVDGYTIILEWLKQGVRAAGARPIHETIAVFVDQATAREFRSNHMTIRELGERAKILAWDGETPLGIVRVVGFDDDFLETHKVKNYKLEAGVSCP